MRRGRRCKPLHGNREERRWSTLCVLGEVALPFTLGKSCLSLAHRRARPGIAWVRGALGGLVRGDMGPALRYRVRHRIQLVCGERTLSSDRQQLPNTSVGQWWTIDGHLRPPTAVVQSLQKIITIPRPRPHPAYAAHSGQWDKRISECLQAW